MTFNQKFPQEGTTRKDDFPEWMESPWFGCFCLFMLAVLFLPGGLNIWLALWLCGMLTLFGSVLVGAVFGNFLCVVTFLFGAFVTVGTMLLALWDSICKLLN